MTFLHIKDSADLAQIPPRFDVSTWNIGRSGDLGHGVEVWTTWLPVHGVFETLVMDPSAHLIAHVDDAQTDTRDEALAQHVRTVERVRAVLAGQEVA